MRCIGRVKQPDLELFPNRKAIWSVSSTDGHPSHKRGTHSGASFVAGMARFELTNARVKV